MPTERLRAQQDETARRVRSRSRSSERSGSWSPSGRKYSPTRDSGNWDLPGGQHSRHRLNTSGRRHKGYQHHSNDRRDEILRTDKRKSSYDESKVASSSRMRVTPSSSTEIAEHLPVYAVKGDMKGKRQVSGMELTDSLAEGGVPEFTAGAEILNADCTPPAVRGKHLRNDAHEMLDQQDASGRPSSSKVFRPPRNKSLLDSVKAHLAGNSISSSGLASETAKRAQIHRGSFFPTSFTGILSHVNLSSSIARFAPPLTILIVIIFSRSPGTSRVRRRARRSN
ncbi:hypothetical protein BDZ97DRAFT_1078462 [Flammula alnicola]|nr:hypothetical protein BDZ97DRAFT_1078462 [Flammula alnicola]